MKMLNYNNFSNKINENLLKNITNYISNVFDFLYGKFKENATVYYAIYLSKKNQLPKDSSGNDKVKIKVPRSWYNDEVYDEIDKMLSEDDIVLPDSINENVTNVFVENDVDIYNIDVKLLKYYITLGYYSTLGSEGGHFDTKDENYKGGPIFIWGVPGIGKTQITNQIAEQLGIQIQVWSLATLDPTDLKGVPFIVKVVNTLTNKLFPNRSQNAVPSVLPKSNWNGKNNKGGILFLDEFNRGNQHVHNAALSLVNNGKIDNYRLPSRWFIVAAGNKLSDLGNMAGTEMSAEMQNRFFHLNLVPKLKDFESHAKSDKKMNPDILEFLSFDESKIHQMDTDPEVLNVDPTFATPRSWTAASKEHYYVVGGDWSKKLSKSELIDIYRPHIGNTAYLFAEYIDMRNNYNVSDILDVYQNGAKAKRDLPRKLDQAWAAIVAITSYVYNKHRKITPTEITNLYEYALNIKNEELVETFMNKIRHYYFPKDDVKNNRIDDSLLKIYDKYKKIWFDKFHK